MTKDVVIVLDCGATNVRAIAVNTQGHVVAKAAIANATQPATENPTWHQWSLTEILERFRHCCQTIMPQLQGYNLHAVTVTTFGVDGALVDAQGELLYPVISWKCPRTAKVMEDIQRYIDPQQLQRITGVGHFSFNTLYKLIWLKEHHPELIEHAHAWLFISSLINQRLTGCFTTDRTMAGTSQLLDVQQEQLSTTVLSAIGLSADLFPPLVNAGEVIGPLMSEAAEFLGLPAGIPVISAGHDTQFALYGSGAEENQPVLSSGTWEILMVRTAQVNTTQLAEFNGSTCELDTQHGLFNPGLQWLASGVLEWVRQLCWPQGEEYEAMIAEARAIAPGCHGVQINPQFLANGQGIGAGAFTGLSLNTTRAHIYRATLEALAFTLRQQLQQLEHIGHFKTEYLLLAGGGSRNQLWNQIRADVLGLPIRVVNEAETTVIGAALFAMSGAGLYHSPEEARQHISINFTTYHPSADAALYTNA